MMTSEDRKITKAQGFRMTITMVLSYLPLIPVFWFLVKPIMVEAVSVAVADDIQHQVEEGVRPINRAFKILLQRDIDGKKREIAALEFKKVEHNGDWTAEDAEDLINCKIDLESLIAANQEL